jgi:hypothetical protein
LTGIPKNIYIVINTQQDVFLDEFSIVACTLPCCSLARDVSSGSTILALSKYTIISLF